MLRAGPIHIAVIDAAPRRTRRPHHRGTKFFSLAISSKLLVVSWSAQVCFCRLALLQTTHPNHKHSPKNILQKRHQETPEITRHHTQHLRDGHLRYRTPIMQNGPTITTITIGIPRRVFFTEISLQPKKKQVKCDPCRKGTPASAATSTRAKSAPTTIAAEPRLASSAHAARVHPHVHPSANSSFLHDAYPCHHCRFMVGCSNSNFDLCPCTNSLRVLHLCTLFAIRCQRFAALRHSSSHRGRPSLPFQRLLGFLTQASLVSRLAQS